MKFVVDQPRSHITQHHNNYLLICSMYTHVIYRWPNPVYGGQDTEEIHLNYLWRTMWLCGRITQNRWTMSASPSKLKESGLTETTSLRPPKSNNPSPSKTSPTLSEILRDHARLFGKKPLISPDRSTMSESDLGSIFVGRSNSISQEENGGTESACTDQAESSVSLSIDSSN